MGESEDLKRMKPAMPAIAAAPTMIFIAISTGAKCPLRRLDRPSKYNQMSAIRKSHTRKRGRAAHEAAREFTETEYRAYPERRCLDDVTQNKVGAQPTPSTRAAMMARQQIAITTGSDAFRSIGSCFVVCNETRSGRCGES